MVGDFGGGGMLLAFGVVCALLEAQRSGLGPGRRRGDGRRVGRADEHVLGVQEHRRCSTRQQRGTNLLDTGAHFYDVYRCADGEYISIGSIEPQFYAELLRLTGLDDDPEFAKQMDKSAWPHLKERLAEVFATKTRDEWCELMEAHRRLLRAGADDERSRAAPAQRRARHVRRGRRDDAAGAGAAVLAHRGRDRHAARASGSAHRGDPRATGASTPPELTH